MKRAFIILLIASILASFACTQTPQKKIIPEDNKQIDLETKESSIFDKGVIEKVRVVNNNSKVRAGYSSDFPIVATLNKGDVVDVVGKFRDWYTVQLVNNYVGAISVEDVTPIVVEEKQPNLPENDRTENESPLEPEPPVDRDIAGEPNADETPDRVVPGPDANEPRQDTDNNLPSLEDQMLSLVNSERAKNNLSPLAMDSQVRQVARIKSQDMVDNNYFSHNSPTYGSPFDMLDEFGVKYIYAGENLAGNSTVQKAHDALMNSSGHRKNILHSQFTHIGIGMRKSDRYGYLFTQMFISKPK
ncbi:MAG: hypothetical protein JM58_15485 [Peptococcaceae bacterium BICA1-8]|nr:MAG: hypothetical protein JM58_15485 [Peptococcaceae bacterium BICA1-8]